MCTRVVIDFRHLATEPARTRVASADSSSPVPLLRGPLSVEKVRVGHTCTRGTAGPAVTETRPEDADPACLRAVNASARNRLSTADSLASRRGTRPRAPMPACQRTGARRPAASGSKTISSRVPIPPSSLAVSSLSLTASLDDLEAERRRDFDLRELEARSDARLRQPGAGQAPSHCRDRAGPSPQASVGRP